MAKVKQIAGIECEGAAAAAIRLVVTTRLKEMSALREKAFDWSDPEGVHDMRVASRRLRSALRDFMPYVRKRRVSHSLQGIKAIADALGRVRDQDVAIIALEKLAAKAPPEVSPGIQALADGRRTRRDEARAELHAILDQDRLVQLQSDFLLAFEAALTPPQGRGKPRQSANLAGNFKYRDVARATIPERLKEFEKLSDSLYHPLKAKPLHRMRIAAKRLRYALELFDQCWGQPMLFFAKKVAALQSSLGELHDCDVWIVDFGDDLANAATQTAIGAVASEREAASLWLLGHFVRLRTKHFRNALKRWREWDANDFSGQLRKLVQIDSSLQAATTSKAAIASTQATGLAPTQDA
ncbi:MAG: CHAD domain-containing protein [Pyrinomonadaceae bacterium]